MHTFIFYNLVFFSFIRYDVKVRVIDKGKYTQEDMRRIMDNRKSNPDAFNELSKYIHEMAGLHPNAVKELANTQKGMDTLIKIGAFTKDTDKDSRVHREVEVDRPLNPVQSYENGDYVESADIED